MLDQLTASTGCEQRLAAWVRQAKRRDDPPYPSAKRAIVRAGRAGTGDPEPAVIWDTPRWGVDLVVASRLRPGAAVRIDFENEAVRPRLARVVHAIGDDDGWMIGCELERPFSAVELEALREPQDG